MVWIPKKSRRAGSKNAVHPNDCNSGTRTLRSCLRVGPDEKLVLNHHTTDSVVDRDHSVRSARSVLSVISGSGSGSSKSRDTSGSDEQAKSSESGGSGESLISGGRYLSKDSRHSPIISSVSEERKSVRFGVVAIREHERAVGDHPCCSTGPPIGIGWRHATTRNLLIDEYEQKRQYRRKRMVLTRSEREELLLNWGISFDDIIDAIRTNIRVKNQRRQTITNLGKVDRFEEALEGATRIIKRAFLLRRRTAEKVKKLQEQAGLAAKLHSPNGSGSEEYFKIQEQAPGISSKEEVIKKEFLNKDSRPDFQETDPSDVQMARTNSFFSDFDDLHTSVSGFSLGNSTTASAREMEQFYRELEIEMFGDIPLPDMVGETLELPGVISDDEYTELPSVTPSSSDMLDDADSHVPHFEWSCLGDETLIPIEPTTSEGCILFRDDPLTAIRMGHALPPNVRMNRDIDTYIDFGSIEPHRVNRARAYLSETVTAMEQRYLHPSLASRLPPYTHGTGDPFDDTTPELAARSSGRSRSQDNSGTRSSSRKDCPIVCHIPLYSKRSATHWMEGHDDSAVFGMNSPQHELVTITEDPRWDDRIRSSATSPSSFDPSPPVFVAPAQFPASFY